MAEGYRPSTEERLSFPIGPITSPLRGVRDLWGSLEGVKKTGYKFNRTDRTEWDRSLERCGLITPKGISDVGKLLLEHYNGGEWNDDVVIVLLDQLAKVTTPSRFETYFRTQKKRHPLSEILTFMNAGPFTKEDLAKAFLTTTELVDGRRVFRQAKFAKNELREAMLDAEVIVSVLGHAGLITFNGINGKDEMDWVSANLNKSEGARDMLIMLMGVAPDIAMRAANYHKDKWAGEQYRKWLCDDRSPLFMVDGGLGFNPDKDFPEPKISRARVVAARTLGLSEVAALEYLKTPITWTLEGEEDAKRKALQSTVDEVERTISEQDGITLAQSILQVASERSRYAKTTLERLGISVLFDGQRATLQEVAMLVLFATVDHYADKGIHPGLTFDKDNRIVTFARGNTPDLSIEYEDFSLVVECTFDVSSSQAKRETEEAMAHQRMMTTSNSRASETEQTKLNDIANKMHDMEDGAKPVYSILVCGSVAERTKYMAFQGCAARAGRLKYTYPVIPITNDAMLCLAQYIHKQRANSATVLQSFLDAAIELTKNEDIDPELWFDILDKAALTLPGKGRKSNINTWIAQTANEMILSKSVN